MESAQTGFSAAGQPMTLDVSEATGLSELPRLRPRRTPSARLDDMSPVAPLTPRSPTSPSSVVHAQRSIVRSDMAGAAPNLGRSGKTYADPADGPLEGVDSTELRKQNVRLTRFLRTAPFDWERGLVVRRFELFGDSIACVLWQDRFFITGTDVVKVAMWRFRLKNHNIPNRKKFEEGVFSDLRNLKPGVDAVLEEPRSKFLDLLYKLNCIRTHKKQKVFFWSSVPHDRLYSEALRRERQRDGFTLGRSHLRASPPWSGWSTACDARDSDLEDDDPNDNPNDDDGDDDDDDVEDATLSMSDRDSSMVAQSGLGSSIAAATTQQWVSNPLVRARLSPKRSSDALEPYSTRSYKQVNHGRTSPAQSLEPTGAPLFISRTTRLNFSHLPTSSLEEPHNLMAILATAAELVRKSSRSESEAGSSDNDFVPQMDLSAGAVAHDDISESERRPDLNPTALPIQQAVARASSAGVGHPLFQHLGSGTGTPVDVDTLSPAVSEAGDQAPVLSTDEDMAISDSMSDAQDALLADRHVLAPHERVVTITESSDSEELGDPAGRSGQTSPLDLGANASPSPSGGQSPRAVPSPRPSSAVRAH